MNARLADTACPSMSLRMASLVTLEHATSSLNSALNLWKSLLKWELSCLRSTRRCQLCDAWSVGMNFSMKSASTVAKVKSA